MLPFAYTRPATLTEAFDELKEHGRDARVLAGGTDLLVELRNRSVRPRIVVDVKRISELGTGIRVTGTALSIGANTVMSDVQNDGQVRTHFGALAEAAAVVGSMQIRHRATLAGNICHASPAADTAPALLAYGAVVNVAGGSGKRRVALREFFTGPRANVLAPDELVVSIELPLPAGRRGGAFARITRRQGVDLATVNLCCTVEAGGTTTFAYGAVGPTPFVVKDETGTLSDVRAGAHAREAVLDEMLSHARPITDVRATREYRLAMLRTISRRALDVAIARLEAA